MSEKGDLWESTGVCDKCSHINPRYYRRQGKNLREGDCESECFYCNDVTIIYGNKESIRELNYKRIEDSDVEKQERYCKRCCCPRVMFVEGDPGHWWRIATCPECNLRHDVVRH
nr:hypothetical protein pmam_364 [Pithovirus mammoth]